MSFMDDEFFEAISAQRSMPNREPVEVSTIPNRERPWEEDYENPSDEDRCEAVYDPGRNIVRCKYWKGHPTKDHWAIGGRIEWRDGEEQTQYSTPLPQQGAGTELYLSGKGFAALPQQEEPAKQLVRPEYVMFDAPHHDDYQLRVPKTACGPMYHSWEADALFESLEHQLTQALTKLKAVESKLAAVQKTDKEEEQ